MERPVSDWAWAQPWGLVWAQAWCRPGSRAEESQRDPDADPPAGEPVAELPSRAGVLPLRGDAGCCLEDPAWGRPEVEFGASRADPVVSYDLLPDADHLVASDLE